MFPLLAQWLSVVPGGQPVNPVMPEGGPYQQGSERGPIAARILAHRAAAGGSIAGDAQGGGEGGLNYLVDNACSLMLTRRRRGKQQNERSGWGMGQA